MFKTTTTYQNGAPAQTKPFTWSYSKLKNYRTCPKKHYHADLAPKGSPERMEDTKGAQLAYGNEVHAAIAARISKGHPLPPAIAHFEPRVQRVIANCPPGTKLLVEQDMAITREFTSTGYWDRNVWYRAKCDVVKIVGPVALAVDWKGLALDTLIPTPSGFVPMSGLAVGDMIFGTDGKPYPVLGKSEVKNLRCYKVLFTSGSSIVCDEEHLWQTVDDGVLPVTRLRKRSKIKLPAPAEYPALQLPIDPYVLGFWLADGKHTSGEASKPDQDVWDEIGRRGYSTGADISANSRCRSHTILGIRGELDALGLLGDKHIPVAYMQASVDQRRDFIRGFADGDGTVNSLRNQAVIEITDEAMARALRQILCSLGERACLSMVRRTGFGKRVTAWMLSWRPRTFNPFVMRRKHSKAARIKPGREYLEVLAVSPVPSVPTQCISVGSPDRMYLCGDYIPTHNTGKIVEDSEQLALMAQCVFSTYPEVQKIRTVFDWLGNDAETKVDLTRADMATLWRQLLPEVQQYEEACRTSTFPPKPSGLCKSYCPVTSCPHHGKGSY